MKMCGVSETHKGTHFTAFTFLSCVTIFPFLPPSGLAYLGGSSAGCQRYKNIFYRHKKKFLSNIVHKSVYIRVSEHFSFAEIIHPTSQESHITVLIRGHEYFTGEPETGHN